MQSNCKIIYLANATVFTEIIDRIENKVMIPGLDAEKGGKQRGTW